MKIPTLIEEITAEWLTEALRAGGHLGAVRVRACAAERMGVGQGLSSQMARLTLTYDAGAPAGAPASLIAKLPPEDDSDRATASRLNLFEIENRFYAELAPEAGVHVPRCFYGDMNTPAQEHVLLLEDMTSLGAGDGVAGCTPERAELVVQHLAEMHAAWWNSPRLEHLSWLKSWRDPKEAALIEELYQRSWSEVEKVGFEIPAAVRGIGSRFGPHSAEIHRQLSQPPWTLVHGDVHLDNVMFGETDNAPAVTILDWQIVGRLRSAYDVATLLVSSLEPDARPVAERSILRSYHDTLVSLGVSGHDFDACLRDYKLAMLSWFSRVIFVGASYDLGNERGHAMIQGLLDRVASALVDLDCGEVIPS